MASQVDFYILNIVAKIMTIYQRPDEKILAESSKQGEVKDFPDISRGWGVAFDKTGGIPPMEWFNALGKRTDEAVRYLLQRGIAEWSKTEDYPTGALVSHNQEIWLAERSSKGVEPKNNTLWKETALTIEQIRKLIPVNSVNGKTGNVVLNAGDVGALSNEGPITFSDTVNFRYSSAAFFYPDSPIGDKKHYLKNYKGDLEFNCYDSQTKLNSPRLMFRHMDKTWRFANSNVNIEGNVTFSNFVDFKNSAASFSSPDSPIGDKKHYLKNYQGDLEFNCYDSQTKSNMRRLAFRYSDKNWNFVNSNVNIEGSLKTLSMFDEKTQIGRTGVSANTHITTDKQIHDLPFGFRGMCQLSGHENNNIPIKDWCYLHKIVNRNNNALASVTNCYAWPDPRAYLLHAHGNNGQKIQVAEYITTYNIEHYLPKTTILYPEGTEANPSTLLTNQRIIIDNPYKSMNIHCIVELYIQADDGNYYWGPSGSTCYWYSGRDYSGGVDAYPRSDNKIVVITGGHAVVIGGVAIKNIWNRALNVLSAPYRVRVTKLS
ncbi:hypothetical protein [Pragia fontium]|uniref:hypothetical protein n=1 Tax=Pragia fontium TaxID=82985 RepID=UPI00064982DC|nr:hypothetical protein [Pragia fontium]AKJ42819.1 hypothetical protein QQ39_12635 [Pragia fontium]